MITSPRYQVQHPSLDRSDAPDIPLHMDNIVTGLEKSVMYGQGLVANRPVSTAGSPGIQGRVYVSTDEVPKQMYYDYGTGWALIGQIDNGSITYAKLENALKPSAGAGAGVEALRALGTAAGTAAAGSHAAQHAIGGADALDLGALHAPITRYALADVALTVAPQDVTASQNLAAGTWVIIGMFDMDVSAVGTGLVMGELYKGGVQTGPPATKGDIVDRVSVSQVWLVTLGATTAVKLSAHKSIAGGTATVHMAWSGMICFRVSQ